jgi:hypothetical protein
MQKDFHYYVIYALAKEGGYDDNDAHVMAYVSQYVDDNTDREYSAFDSHGEFYVGFPDKVGESGDFYFPKITQAVDITSFKLSVQRYVFAPFHFIPGDDNVEINGKKNPLCTTRGCVHAVNLVQDAIRNGDLYRIGVALHTYADTWSHERFSAFHEDWNKVSKSIFGSLPPNIGHAEVFHKPDEISLVWEDERFEGTIDNKERALRAAEEIFGFIKKGTMQWDDVKSTFETIMNAQNFDERIKSIRNMHPAMEEYEEDKWLNEALTFTRDSSEIPEYDALTGRPSPNRPRFVDVSVRDINAHWFRFQNAAKKQLAMVIGMVDAL